MNQKRRTRDTMIAAAQAIVEPETPTVAQAANDTLVSRTTAYRYFPTQDSLLLELTINMNLRGLEDLAAQPQDGTSPSATNTTARPPYRQPCPFVLSSHDHLPVGHRHRQEGLLGPTSRTPRRLDERRARRPALECKQLHRTLHDNYDDRDPETHRPRAPNARTIELVTAARRFSWPVR